jgi:hypothetical protein
MCILHRVMEPEESMSLHKVLEAAAMSSSTCLAHLLKSKEGETPHLK